MAMAIYPQDSDQSARAGQSSGLPIAMVALLAILLTGCAGPGLKSDTPLVAPPPAQETSSVASAGPAPCEAEIVVAPDPLVWSRLQAGFALSHFEHPRIDLEVRRLTRFRAALDALLRRTEPYLHHILNAVEAAGFPTEIALLPAVESGFRPHAYSPNGAAGLWQFMPATGRMLGLERDWWYDGRRSLPESTRAAMVYLERLHRRFDGDWLHALAAYNAGSAKVGRAIRRARKRRENTEYWGLDLPGETDAYVPRLLALARVVASPDTYGVSLPAITDRRYFDVVDTDGQIDLHVAAELAAVSVETVLRLNPGYRRWATHPEGPHQLLLPIDKVQPFSKRLARLPVEQRLRWQRHRIVSGDNLIGIARRYGVTVEAIKRSNDLTDSRIRAGRDLLIPLSDLVGSGPVTASNGQGRQRVRYQVRRGDSLYAIARRFQVSIADLRRWNRVGRYLQPGDRLTVFVDPDA